jgi:hypothetical protein
MKYSDVQTYVDCNVSFPRQSRTTGPGTLYGTWDASRSADVLTMSHAGIRKVRFVPTVPTLMLHIGLFTEGCFLIVTGT